MTACPSNAAWDVSNTSNLFNRNAVPVTETRCDHCETTAAAALLEAMPGDEMVNGDLSDRAAGMQSSKTSFPPYDFETSSGIPVTSARDLVENSKSQAVHSPTAAEARTNDSQFMSDNECLMHEVEDCAKLPNSNTEADMAPPETLKRPANITKDNGVFEATTESKCSTPLSTAAREIHHSNAEKHRSVPSLASVVHGDINKDSSVVDRILRATTSGVCTTHSLTSPFVLSKDLGVLSSKPRGASPAVQSPTLSMADIAIVLPDALAKSAAFDPDVDFLQADVDQLEFMDDISFNVQTQPRPTSSKPMVSSSTAAGADHLSRDQAALPKEKKLNDAEVGLDTTVSSCSLRSSELSDSGFSESVPRMRNNDVGFNFEVTSPKRCGRSDSSLTDSDHLNGNGERVGSEPAGKARKYDSTIRSDHACVASNAAAEPSSGELKIARNIAYGYFSSESSDGGEWQCVVNNRSKHKRKHVVRLQNGDQHNKLDSDAQPSSKPPPHLPTGPQQRPHVQSSGRRSAERSRAKISRQTNAGRLAKPISFGFQDNGQSKNCVVKSSSYVNTGFVYDRGNLSDHRYTYEADFPEIDQKLNTQSSNAISQGKGLPYSNGVVKSNNSEESVVVVDPSAMNGAENSKNEAQTSNYQQVLNGVKSETPAEVDENSNPRFATAAQHPPTSVGEEPAADLPAEGTASHPKLEGNELIEQLKRQLEYYFSKENLPRDSYLMSQMDSEGYAQIGLVANFNAVKKLTDDINLVKEAIKSSTMLKLDDGEERVGPNHSRCIVIIREIPGDTPVETVRELFDSKDCPKVLSCEFAGGSCWYVTFANEPDAQAAYRHLRENVGSFRNTPIMARIKSKSHYVTSYPRMSQPLKPEAQAVQQVPQTPTGQQPDLHASQPQPLTSSTQQFDFIQVAPQNLVYTSQLPGAPAHPVSHVAAMPTGPPFLSRVAQSPVPAPGAQSQASAAISVPQPPQFNVMLNWPGYFSSEHMLNPPFGPFVTSINPPQANLQTSNTGTKSGQQQHLHRFSDVHKVLNQKSNYGRKPSGGTYSQPPQSQPSGTHFILSNDPNPPVVVQERHMLATQFSSGEHPAVTVAQSMQMAGQSAHYLPAIRHFATPNDQMMIMRHQPQMPTHPQQQHVVPPRHRDQRTILQSSGPHQSRLNTTSYSSHPSNAGSVPNSNSSRNNRGHSRNYPSYTPEIPRLNPHKNQQASYSLAGVVPYQKTVAPNVQTVPAVEPLHQLADHKHIYSQRTSHVAPSSEPNVRNRRSPESDRESNEHRYNNETVADAGDTNRRFLMSRNQGSVNAQPAPNGLYPDQRTRSAPMDQRRGSRMRRTRRDDEKPMRTSPGNEVSTPFTLESTSFPPLPGSISTTATNGGVPDGRPAAADVVRGADTTKVCATEAPPPAPLKKYSVVSGASGPTAPAPQQVPKPVPVAPPVELLEKVDAAKPKPEAKRHLSASKDAQTAENGGQPVKPRLHTPQAKTGGPEKTTVVERPKAPPAGKSDEQPAPSLPQQTVTVVNANAAVVKKSAPPSAQPSRGSSFKKTASPKTDVAAKVDSSPKDDAQAKAEAHKPTVQSKKETTKESAKPVETDNKQSDSSKPAPTSSSPTPEGRRPTYADMLRKQQSKKEAAANAAQVNGKESSDSGKSDSGDEIRSADEAKDSIATESKAPAEGPGPSEAKPQRAQHKSRGSSTEGDDASQGPVNERRHDGPLHNGYGRRSGYDGYRGGRGGYYRDFDRNYGYGPGGRGSYRGRGYRGSGRRGPPRDRYYGNQQRSAPSAPAAASER